MATSSRKPPADNRPIDDVGRLVRRLRSIAGSTPVPLLVVRVRDLERIAWLQGRAAARMLERRSLRSFNETASRTLRATDLLAHDADSEDFIAALVSPTRSPGNVTTPSDCRAALARLSSAMEFAGGLRVETGWTILYDLNGDASLSNAIEQALERGARERERYAFFSTIGHELRTPLTSIRGYLETLIEEQDLDSETKLRFLEVARAEAVRLGRLVDGMFDVSMLDLRAEETGSETTELRTSIANALDALAPLAATRRVSLNRVPTEDYRVAIGGDRLVQMLINLIENAIKHGHEGGRVVVSVAPEQHGAIEVDIDDDGPGVPGPERELVFSLAQRGSNVSSKGNGLGLAVVRLMLQRVGGEVDVLDSPLGGARFRMRLPLAVEAAPAVQS